ncbi:MAG TPA: DUF192 domain-containing protein [Clostridia bacterium]|nr:DUF192 domain-containing protein [Clostridia bacterium]
MKKLTAYSEKRKERIISDINLTDNFMERFLGLMGKTDVGAEALIIEPCKSIHMFFMKMMIDAVFLDKNGRIIAMEKNLMPWSVSGIYKNGRSVMEMPSGSADRLGLECGEVLRFFEKEEID